MERKVCFTTIVKVDVITGRSFADLDSLTQIILDNEEHKLSTTEASSRYEDTVCPPNEIVDEIIGEMIFDFKEATGEDIKCVGYWGHIHDKNMSTNTHNHGTEYASAVLYLSVPEGSGDLVFVPKINQYDNSSYKSVFAPKRGKYYMFPSYLDHYVTRNKSEEKRISISFNFQKA